MLPSETCAAIVSCAAFDVNARRHRRPPRKSFDLMHLSAASSGDGSDSEDSEESRVSRRDIRDRPRDLETHFRVRFNASGLATEGGPIGELSLFVSPREIVLKAELVRKRGVFERNESSMGC